MKRTHEELRTQISSLVTYVKKVQTNVNVINQPIPELFREIDLLANYILDIVDTMESEIENVEQRVTDLEHIVDNQSQRSIVLIKDISSLDSRLKKAEELDRKVDNLTDIILRSLKQLPVKGADEEDEEHEEETEEQAEDYDALTLRPWKREFTLGSPFSNGKIIDVPVSFTGKVFLNNAELHEGQDFFYQPYSNVIKQIHIDYYLTSGSVITIDGFT